MIPLKHRLLLLCPWLLCFLVVGCPPTGDPPKPTFSTDEGDASSAPDGDAGGTRGDAEPLGDCVDHDHDGFVTGVGCGLPTGDCAPHDPQRWPGAREICNLIDDNCDFAIDNENAGGCINYHFDKDGDGWGVADKKCLCKPSGKYKAPFKGQYDCNDNDPSVSPGALEKCTGGDENCDGKINEAGAQGCKTYYPDADGDGFGAKVSGKCTCGKSANYAVENNSDCYDGNKHAWPGQSSWFISHRGDGSFDYDCDGAETRKWILPGGNCSTFLGFCSATQKGFKGGVPSCGKFGSFLNDCDSGFFSCGDKNTNIQQECH